MKTMVDTESAKNGSSHKVSLVQRDAWGPAYGDTTEKCKEPWLECTCGYSEDLFGNHHNRYELARLNHLLIAIAKEVGVIIA